MGPWIRHLRLAVSQPQPLNARKPRGGWRDWLRLVPEVALLLGAMVLADAFLFGGHRFADWALHPFWLPVLLAAAQYGLSGGAFAALAATLALYLGALPDKGADQDYYEYVGALALQPAAWFATATLLGALRNLQAHTENQLRRALAGAEDRLEAVTDGMDRAVSEIERLERRLASDTATVNRILENFARVELATPQSFSDSMARLVADTLDVTLFAVYLRSARGFELATVFDEDGDSPRMEPSATLFEALIAGGGQAITRETASASALPLGATIAVPLLAPDGQHVTGAVVLERFRTPPQNLAATAARAALIGRVLGTLLEATGETGGHRAASVERLRAASEG